jgi:hypothetical protein
MPETVLHNQKKEAEPVYQTSAYNEAQAEIIQLCEERLRALCTVEKRLHFGKRRSTHVLSIHKQPRTVQSRHMGTQNNVLVHCSNKWGQRAESVQPKHSTHSGQLTKLPHPTAILRLYMSSKFSFNLRKDLLNSARPKVGVR